MLIKALYDYYDELARKGKVLPEEYSLQDVRYCICLNPDGKIDQIANIQEIQESVQKDGKVKRTFAPIKAKMPKRSEKTAIKSNIIEHRPLYIFGLNYDGSKFTPVDEKNKAEKSHAAFVKENLEFIDGLDSPVINAYRNFIQSWNPSDETENSHLIALGKAYGSSGFTFCLSGRMDLPLHEDTQIKEKWEATYAQSCDDADNDVIAQCGITGRKEPIARIHNKIYHIYGGNSTGSSLIGYKTTAGCSYGNEQSYNSNISETAMKKYTTAFNTLLDDNRHKKAIDDITVVYWATGAEHEENCCDLISALVFGDNDVLDENRTNEMLDDLIKAAKDGNIRSEKLSDLNSIDENVNFYIVGLKPNSARVSLKFIYQKRFGEILKNIALHQSDMQISTTTKSVPMWRLKSELISPNSSNETVDPALMAAVFKAVIYGTDYPPYLLNTLVKRVKTDKYVNYVRAGAIKACINRKARLKSNKEELTLALDTTNTNQAYLCGRLFAVLEKLQRDASGGDLNRTIKDAYFSSAASKPALIFPKLLKLAQSHMKKTKYPGFYSGCIEEIISGMNGEFPETLMLVEQGKFIIGYYHQYESFFNKTNKTVNEEEN